MASLDAGSSSQSDDNILEPKHSIFLSHSGAQKSFVDQLCLDIERHDRYAFFDKRRSSLSIGCKFPDLIFKAIKQCQVAVVVLSEEFFSRSKWPMLELAAMVKRDSHGPKLVIMPVFLGLTHAQCRDPLNQKRWRTVWKHWERQDKSRINLKDWDAALKVFGYTNGIHLDGVLDEVKCRGEIVEAICKEVPPRTRWDDSHVQGRSHLCMAIRAKIDGVQVSKSYGARILGVYGVGGIGKTTACKVLCNDYFEEFGGMVCHVEFGSGSKLLMLQEILRRLTETNRKLIKDFNEDECKDRLKKKMKMKVFLAIDNVWDRQQVVDDAKDLLRMGFVEGSIVIVTARSLPQLRILNLEECMEMPELDEVDARSLFLYHAALGLYFKIGDELNEQLLNGCIKRCYFGKGDGKSHHYHPLALKVLGGQLGNDPKEWSEKLNEVDPFNQYQEDGSVHPIFSILGRSFETLKEEDQFLFMDVTIFAHKSFYDFYMKHHLNNFEWLSMVYGKSPDIIKKRLEGLRSKSLVECLGDGIEEIGIHDLWREFAVMKSKGTEIHSGLWLCEKVYGESDPRREEPKLSAGGGLERLQRLCMVGVGLENCILKNIDLNLCSNLKVLKLVNISMDTEMLDVGSLRQLKSLDISSSILPHELDVVGLGCLRNLAYLRLCRIRIRSTSLHEDIGGLTTLQALFLLGLHSPSASELDLSRLNLLRDVYIHWYAEVNAISGLSSKMKNLKRLNLSECTSLRSCNGVGELVALERLGLCGFSMLEELPNLGRLKQLLKLDISWCVLIEVVPGFGDLVSLQTFRAIGCITLAEVPEMGKLINLQELSVPWCSSLKAMPGLSDLVALRQLWCDPGVLNGYHDLSKLTKLEKVEVNRRGAGGKLVPCLSDLVNLKILRIEVAEELTDLDTLTRLQELEIGYCESKDVQCLSKLGALKSLSVFCCDNWERLPDMHWLTSLESLSISHCRSLRDWESGSGLRMFGADLHKIAGTLPQLRSLDLHDVAFTDLPDLSNFPQLGELAIINCKELTRLTSSVPLTALQLLYLSGCKRLRALPDVTHLVSLSSFDLMDCGELKLTAHEIEKLEAMCSGLRLDKSHLHNMRLNENDDDRDGKRLKLIDN